MLLPLLAVLSILAYVQYTRYQDLLLDNLRASAANAGEIIEGSLQHAMVTNDFSTVQQIADNIGQQPGVQDLFLWSKSGHVLISTDHEMIGQTFTLGDASCQICHRYAATSRNENVILTLDQRVRVFRNVNVLENSAECQSCHDPAKPVLGVLISDFDMAPVDRALANSRRSSILWSAGSILLVLVMVHLLMSKMVVSRLEHFVEVVKRVDEGDLRARVSDELWDEIGELAHSFNEMADGLTEKENLERSLKQQTKQLQAQAAKLATLNTLADTVSQSLNLREILHNALDKVLELIKLKAGWIVLQGEQDAPAALAASSGLPEEVARAHTQCAWTQCICSQVLELGQPRIFDSAEGPHSGPRGSSCPTAQYFAREGLVFRACIPLTSKDRVLGVMSLVGDGSGEASALAPDTLETLTALGHQIGMAVENASLYEELRQQEVLRRMLLERIISVQEQERKRIALELHDQTGQPLTSLIMTLGLLGEAQSLAEARALGQQLRDTAAEVLRQVHDLALELRPSVLDDLGLLAALRYLRTEFEDRFHIPVDLQVVGMDGQRLKPEVETTLYRIVQEALTNVAKHSQAHNVSVLLEYRGSAAVLIVEDDGQGFDVSQVTDLGTRQERIGLYSMQERASLLGGTFTIESTPGMGTTIFVEIRLDRDQENDGQDPAAGS
jgi:signal transduction histidine kinase